MRIGREGRASSGEGHRALLPLAGRRRRGRRGGRGGCARPPWTGDRSPAAVRGQEPALAPSGGDEGRHAGSAESGAAYQMTECFGCSWTVANDRDHLVEPGARDPEPSDPPEPRSRDEILPEKDRAAA